MKPIICYLKHKYVPFQMENEARILCQNCGKNLESVTLDENKRNIKYKIDTNMYD